MKYSRELVLLSLTLLLLPMMVQPSLVRASVPQRNALNPASAQPSSTQPSVYTSPNTLGPKILLYDDDVLLSAANQYSRLALVNLGLPFVQHYADPGGFFTDLTSNGPWDCVIIDQNDYGFGSSWNTVNSYLTGGGRAVVSAWDIDESLGSPVWATLGAQWSYVFFSPTKPLYTWQSGSPILTGIPSPFNPTDTGTTYSRNGHGMNALATATAVAGWTPTPSSGQASIIVRNDRKTILNSFIVPDFRSHSGADAVRLWTNEIGSTCGGVTVNLVLKTYKIVNVLVQVLQGSMVVASRTVTLTYASSTASFQFQSLPSGAVTVKISGYSIAIQTQTTTPPATLTFYIN